MTSAINGIINFKQGTRNYLDATIRSQSLAFDLENNKLLYSPSGTNYYEFSSDVRTERYISVLDFGAIGDGINDDSNSFVSAINYASTNNCTIKVPSGIYYLKTWNTKDVFCLNMVGDNYNNTRIIGKSTPGSYFVNILSGGSVNLNGISLENFDNCVYSTYDINEIIVSNCKFINNRNRAVYLNGYSSNIYVTSSTTNPERKCFRVLFNNNYIEKSQGIVIEGGFDSAIATNNHFYDIRRNLDIWSDGSDRKMYCVCFGWLDNIPESVSQKYMKRAVVSNNTIDGMLNTSPSGTRTINGIIVAAKSVVVCNNVIQNISAVPGSDAEAIYCKSQDYICSNNVIYDGSPEGSSITLKGGTYSAPLGRNNLVSNNIIRSIDSVCKFGIAVFNSGYVTIKDNIIDGTTDDAILLYNDLKNVNIIGNQIYDCGSTKIINFSCSQLDNIRVEDNTIINPTKKSGSILPFRVTTQIGWYVPESIKIVSGGSGYTSLPKIVWNGTTLSNPRLYIHDGVLVGFYTDETPAGFPPTIIVSGGGGSGAIISATELTDGHFKNVSFKNNKIIASPKKPISEFNAFSMSIPAISAGLIDNIEFIDNTIILSGSYSDLTTYNKIIDFYIATPVDSLINNLIIDNIKIFTDLTDTQLSRLVTINAEPLSKHWKKYDNIKISNVYFNNRLVDIPVKSNIGHNCSTFSLNFDSTSGYVGNIKLGDIPGNNIITETYVVNGSSPIKSLTSASTISLYGYSVTGGNQLLSATSISAFSANSIIQGNQNGMLANNKMFSANSSGNVPIYLTIGNESITSGSIKFVIKTMQY